MGVTVDMYTWPAVVLAPRQQFERVRDVPWYRVRASNWLVRCALDLGSCVAQLIYRHAAYSVVSHP